MRNTKQQKKREEEDATNSFKGKKNIEQSMKSGLKIDPLQKKINK